MTDTKKTNRARGEGALYFDKARDRWIGEMYDAAGKRTRVSDRTKAGAGRKLAALRTTIDGGAVVAEASLTVGAVMEAWFRSSVKGNPDIAPGTIDGYRWVLDRLTDVLGKHRVRTLTVRQMEDAFLDLAEGDDTHRPMGRASLVKAKSALAQSFDEAIRLGDMQSNIARLVKVPRVARPTKEGRSMTPKQVALFLHALPEERLGAMFTVMVTIGLRPGEAAGLLWESVDLDAGHLSVEHAVRTEGGRAVLVDSLKTAKSRRTIGLPPFVVDALRCHRTEQLTQRLAASSWADERLVFSTRVGTPLGSRNVARDLRQITEALGLGEWTPNELRHSAASVLSKVCGLTDREVADVLGHTTLKMFQTTYNHRTGVVAHATAPMQAAFGG